MVSWNTVFPPEGSLSIVACHSCHGVWYLAVGWTWPRKEQPSWWTLTSSVPASALMRTIWILPKILIVKILLQCTTVTTRNPSLFKNFPAKWGTQSNFCIESALLNHVHARHYFFSIQKIYWIMQNEKNPHQLSEKGWRETWYIDFHWPHNDTLHPVSWPLYNQITRALIGSSSYSVFKETSEWQWYPTPPLCLDHCTIKLQELQWEILPPVS